MTSVRQVLENMIPLVVILAVIVFILAVIFFFQAVVSTIVIVGGLWLAFRWVMGGVEG